jgi:RNA polymerase sigma factor (sigma-70 family)
MPGRLVTRMKSDEEVSHAVHPGATRRSRLELGEGMTCEMALRPSSTRLALPPFQMLLEEHGLTVYRFLVAKVGPQEANDCWQETFLAALKSYDGLRPDSNLRAWLLTIADRKAIDFFRARGRGPVPHASLPEPAGAAVREELGLWEAVRELPPKQRTAVVLRYVNRLPYREIAAIVESSEEAARQSVRAGLKRLRKEWRR